MIINSIALKNFKSYGNNLQKVPFKNGGELILLSGDNEVGKSSLIESIDFTLYGIVRGKNTKKVALAKLPNRTNKNLETEINFNNDDGDNVIIRRRLEPTSIEIFRNGHNYLKEFKAMTNEQREKFIGLEYNTYKSLISLNMSDFANFINLDIETKRKLVNKMFNISEIDEYYVIAKEVVKNSYKEKERLESHILMNSSTIETYNQNIQNIKSQLVGIDKEEIKNEILLYKPTYDTLKHERYDLSISIGKLNKDIKNNNDILEGKKNKIIEESATLKELIKKIEIFKSGICPVCDSKLNTDDKKHKLDDLLTEESNQIQLINDLKKEYLDLKNETNSLSYERNSLSNEYNKKNNEFGEIGTRIGELRIKYETPDVDSISINEIKKNIEKLEKENSDYQRKLDDVKDKIERWEKTVDYLSEKGIRKNIIKSMVDPINKNLEFFLKEINSKYHVKLNDEFDAIIQDRYNEIDSETLSSGGRRKINIAIALSYIKMVVEMSKRINVLFLDEIFSSISPSNINIILRVLKEFSKKYNINIVIVHHINFDNNMFDRVIHIDMKYFSTIIDTYKKEEKENGN